MRDEAIAFEKLVREIFSSTDSVFVDNINNNFDLVMSWEGYEIIAEVKHYRTMRAQVSLISRAISNFKRTKEIMQRTIEDDICSMLIISSYLEPKLKSTIENEEDMIIVDFSDLISITSDLPDLRDRLVKSLEVPENFLGLQGGRTFDELFSSEEVISDIILRSPPEYVGEPPSVTLMSRLESLSAGKENWKNYEILMMDILKYLFKDDLKGWYTQYESNNKLNRYDCVCGVKKNTEFWSFLVEQLKSNYILFEFKNYTGLIGQGEVLTTEKYLFENAFRKVAFIFSRKGGNSSALEMCMGAMRESGRLILILNDEDVRGMLEMKDSGSDPSDYLLEKADDFLMRLSR